MDETLIESVSAGTGLSREAVTKILNEWIIETGRSPQNISLEDFREVLVHIMQNLFAEVASGENDFIRLSR